MTYAIILAGGSGTRFWPLSRKNRPKQFISLCSDKPMIEVAVKRVRPFIKSGNTYIATNRIYYKKIWSCLKGLGVRRQNILFEPQAKNTLAPIGVLSNSIYKRDRNAVIAVLPSDHHIGSREKFLGRLREAVKAAEKGYIVTIGIKPTYPETGYGYVKIKSQSHKDTKSQVFEVNRFIEKPDIERAKQFLKDKKFYWNAGIFIFRAETLLGEVRKFAPKQYAIITRINGRGGPDSLWAKLKPVSIDYAVMQKSKKIALVPSDFLWLDLGSWKTVEYFAKKDGKGNIFKGNCIDIGSRNVLAWSEAGILATIGLNNMIVVSTRDAVLVCDKDKAQDVRKIVSALRQRKQFRLI